MLNSTSPSSVGPVGVLGIFVMAYFLFVGAISLFLYGGFRVIQMILLALGGKHSLKARDYGFFLKFSFVFAFAPIILIAQQSSGGIGIFDIILLAIFQILSFIIVLKR